MKVVRVYHAGRDAAHRERERALVRAGVDVTLVVPAEWPGPDDLGDEPFEVVQLPVTRPGDVNRHRYADPGPLVDVIAQVRPDVVDLHEEPFSAVVHQLLRGLPGDQPVVAYAAQNIDKRFPPPFAQWEKQALGRINGLYPCTRQAASVAVGKGFNGLISVLPLATSPLITRGAQVLPDETLQLVLVGRLVPEKGVLDAVHVLAQVSAARNASLTLVGAGPEADRARDLAARLGVADRLAIDPWLGAAELAKRYQQAHVLLAPSRATRTWVEQFGRMVVEAQAAGAVVVGYASGSLPEVIGDAGRLVAEGDVEALSAAVVELAQDPATWSRLRDAGFAAATGRTWDAVAEGQKALYEAVASARPVRARLRPRRAQAVAEYGPPAQIAGGGRPFALPLLREDNAATRALAKGLDRVARDESRPSARRIKVVYVDHVAKLSGGELALARLITAMPEVDAHVILGEDGPLRTRLERAGATVEILPLDPATRDVRKGEVGGKFGNARAALHTLFYVIRLARRIRAIRPDLVHTNSLKSGYYGSLAARLARTPAVWHLRDRLAEDYLPRRAIILTRAALRVLPTFVVGNSTETRALTGLSSARTAVVPSPLDAAAFGPVPRRSSEATAIGIVGRLAPWKGQDVLLRSVAALKSDFPSLTVRLVGSAMFGEDDYADHLHEIAGELGIADRVTFTGFVEDVAGELAKIDILVHASVTPEPFGQVVVEGMASGLPVIATRAGGPAEIITDGADGLLVEPGSVDALIAAVRRLVVDPELRALIASRARVRARDFAPDVVAERMLEVYSTLIDRH